MDDVKTQAPDDKEPVTVKPGGVESEPISSVPEVVKQPELSEIQNSEPSPELDKEVRESGVEVASDTPKIDDSAKDAGVTESIPKGPVYGNFPTDQNEALQTYKTGDSSDANTWRSLSAIFERAKQQVKDLFNPKKPQEGH